jgi:MSHA biogenesis protein MshQ
VCSNTVTLGRFIPSAFTVTAQALVPGCAASTPFTYFGQGFSTPFVLSAVNASGAVTANYSGTLAKLNLGAWANFGFSGSGLASGFAVTAGSSAPSGTWSSGVASVSAAHLIAYPTGVSTTPPASVSVLTRPTDSDGVTIASATAVNASPATFYAGRVSLSGAEGPSAYDLNLPMSVQYWQSNTAGWQTNAADTCTQASIQLTAGSLAASATCVEDSGSPGNSGAGCATASAISTHRFLKAGVSGTDSNGVAGFAGNFNLWLAGPGSGYAGYVTATAVVPSYLLGGLSGNPSAIASFGTGNSGPVIFKQEQ